MSYIINTYNNIEGGLVWIVNNNNIMNAKLQNMKKSEAMKGGKEGVGSAVTHA